MQCCILQQSDQEEMCIMVILTVMHKEGCCERRKDLGFTGIAIHVWNEYVLIIVNNLL